MSAFSLPESFLYRLNKSAPDFGVDCMHGLDEARFCLERLNHY